MTDKAQRHGLTSRRGFLYGAGIGIGGLVTVGTAGAKKPHNRDPHIVFPDGPALVLPENNPSDLEAAVTTKDVFMPEGGYVRIFKGEQPIGRSIHELPAGQFSSLKVATQALEPKTHNLTAELFKPNLKGPYEEGVPSDSAEITFSEPLGSN